MPDSLSPRRLASFPMPGAFILRFNVDEALASGGGAINGCNRGRGCYDDGMEGVQNPPFRIADEALRCLLAAASLRQVPAEELGFLDH